MPPTTAELTMEPLVVRGQSIQEALAAAEAALGCPVRAIKADRVRRGGIGGFFATDLGVEVTAVLVEPTPISADMIAEQERMVSAILDAPAGSFEDALDRLVNDAARGDRPPKGVAPIGITAPAPRPAPIAMPAAPPAAMPAAPVAVAATAPAAPAPLAMPAAPAPSAAPTATFARPEPGATRVASPTEEFLRQRELRGLPIDTIGGGSTPIAETPAAPATPAAPVVPAAPLIEAPAATVAPMVEHPVPPRRTNEHEAQASIVVAAAGDLLTRLLQDHVQGTVVATVTVTTAEGKVRAEARASREDRR